MRLKTFPIFLAFLVMGVADAMGPMSDALKDEYQVSNVMATMSSFFVFIAFAVCSVPAALLATRIGMKKLLVLGLGLNALAVLVPSLMLPSFALLLGCIFVLGIGTTCLQVAGNPIMRDVSAEGAYSRNLSFAQGIKGLGSTLSAWLVTAIGSFAFFQSMGWRGAFPFFCLFMAIGFVWVATLKIDEQKPDVPPSIISSLSLLKTPVFALAVVGIFLYVGAEVCMGRFVNPTIEKIVITNKLVADGADKDRIAAVFASMGEAKQVIADREKAKKAEGESEEAAPETAGEEELTGAPIEEGTALETTTDAPAEESVDATEKDELIEECIALVAHAKPTVGLYGSALFFLMLTVGRIGGGVALTKVQPRPAFCVSALAGAVGAGMLMSGNLQLAIAGVVIAGLGFANIWPLLFSITVEEKPERAAELSGLMCMAISGGAIVPLVMSQLVDMQLGNLAYIVPVACFLYLFAISLMGGSKKAAVAEN